MAEVPEHTLTVEYLITVIAFAITVGAGIWRIRVQLDDKIDKRVLAVEQELATQVERVKAAFSLHQQQHNDFKLEVAQTYASQTHLKETEERLVSAINKLEATISAMPASIAALIKSGQRAVRSRS
jgi:hypothetical protein